MQGFLGSRYSQWFSMVGILARAFSPSLASWVLLFFRVPPELFTGLARCPLPGAAVRAFSLMAVFWGLGSAVKPVGAF